MTKQHMAVLFLGIEDCSGLWEILLDPNFYDLAESTRLNSARHVVEELAGAGFLSLYRCQEGSDLREEIAKKDWHQVLSTSERWQPSAKGSEAIRFETTPQGAGVYWEAEAR